MILGKVFTALLDALLFSIAFVVLKCTWTLYKNYTNPLWRLKGPPRGSFFWGNVREMWTGHNLTDCISQYGRAHTEAEFFGRPNLVISDTKAVAHVVFHANDYPKDEAMKYDLSELVGPGVLVVEGEEHKRQILIRRQNPAFGNAHVKELVPTFFDKALELRELLVQECASNPSGYHTNALDWMTKVTLDIIGLAGFGYNFHALDPNVEKTDLQRAFDAASDSAATPFRMIQAKIPFFRLFPTANTSVVREAQRCMDRIGARLLSDAKSMVALGDKASSGGRDMFSLLVRANTSSDLPDHQKLSDRDVMSQVPTFFVAGHETTSASLVWMLYALTLAPHIQKKLRQELQAVSTDTPSFDELNALPYLDAVLRETLRLHAPVSATERVATKEDILPLSEPIEDRRGKMLDGIRVQAGDIIIISMLGMNIDPAIWGADAHEFKPERWMAPKAGVTASIPGVWSNMMSFWGGARGCVGFRFSIAEAKALAFILFRAFEFELAVKHEELTSEQLIVQKPYLANDMAAGPQLPVIIRSAIP
ncbi:cytochrome P450 [Cylindrobasidium torrendii FP15055 ss-10]|uniref:Cytochrome P450 n=1 Tax=Cylindrobasidium torrendii FP15055 ss-10 TaxID=1314674 RepID=A0A0D7BE75_9AGAR|nr:cytochrome P450 [Cylindrobasidium torrendii FP15055 ss-10]